MTNDIFYDDLTGYYNLYSQTIYLMEDKESGTSWILLP